MRRFAAIGIVAGLIALVLALALGRDRESGSPGDGPASGSAKVAASKVAAPRGVKWRGVGGDDAARQRDGERRDIAGQVVDALSGAPIDGATVSLRTVDGDEIAAASTDGDGRFRFDAIAGADVVAASARGYAFLAERVGRGDHVLLLDPAVRLRGVVVDGAGAPVAGAEVWAEDGEGDDWERWPRPASDVVASGADGSFAIDDAPSGRIVVHATHPRFSRGEIEVGGIGAGGMREGIRVALGDAGTIAGLVLDGDGNPVAGATVRVFGEGRSEGGSVVTKADGSFEATGIRPGTVWVAAEDESRHGSVDASVDAGGTTRVEIRLVPAGVLAGRVVDEAGAPIAGADVSARPASHREARTRIGFLRGRATTDESGRFRIDGLEANGNVRLWVSAEGFHSEDVATTVSPKELTITLAGGFEIFGTLTAADGAPVANGEVAASADAGNRRRRFGTRTGADGSWRFRSLDAGEWRIRGEAPGFAPSQPVVVSVTEDGSHGPIAIVLGASGKVHGRVLGADGAELPGARVSVSRQQRTWMEGDEAARLDWRDAVRTDHRGRFSLDAGSGSISLFVYHPEHHAEVVRVEVPEGGDADAGTIQLRAGSGASAIYEFSGIGAVIAGDDGAFVVREVLPGSPAERSGVRARDVIVAIDGVETQPMDMDEVITRIRGPVGTTVTLTLRRDGNAEPLEIHVVREKVRT